MDISITMSIIVFSSFQIYLPKYILITLKDCGEMSNKLSRIEDQPQSIYIS